MKDKFMNLPWILQRQIAGRALLGLINLLLFIVILFCYGDYHLYLPFILLAGFSMINTMWMFCGCIMGAYCRVQGVCRQIEQCGFRMRVKWIEIDLDQNNILRIVMRYGEKDIITGDLIIVYLSKNAQVYGQDGKYMVNSYYAIESKKCSEE